MKKIYLSIICFLFGSTLLQSRDCYGEFALGVSWAEIDLDFHVLDCRYTYELTGPDYTNCVMLGMNAFESTLDKLLDEFNDCIGD
jgi:hypothetical protein